MLIKKANSKVTEQVRFNKATRNIPSEEHFTEPELFIRRGGLAGFLVASSRKTEAIGGKQLELILSPNTFGFGSSSGREEASELQGILVDRQKPRFLLQANPSLTVCLPMVCCWLFMINMNFLVLRMKTHDG